MRADNRYASQMSNRTRDGPAEEGLCARWRFRARGRGCTAGNAPCVNVPLVGGEDVAAVVERDGAVPFDALPRHGVRLDRVEQRNPTSPGS